MTPARRRHHVRRARAGFTLIEAMATIVVLGVIGTGTSMILLSAVDSYLDAAETAQLHSEMSIALDRIMREIRKIERDGGAAGIAPDINSMSSQSIYWSDSDADTWSVARSGSNLMLAVDGGAAATLLGDVSSISIRGYDESNNALGLTLTGTQCDPVRRITVTLTVSRGGITRTLRSRVFIRSTMTGTSA